MPPYSYEDYLHLEALLGAIEPLTPTTDRVEWTAERFFLVCHQISEIWVSQLFADLALVLDLANAGELRQAVEAMDRANAVLVMTQTTLSAFEHLRIEDFRRFRPRLQGASGAQSPQFTALLAGAENPMLAELRDVVAERDEPEDARRQRDELRAHAAVLEVGTVRWRLAHLKLVRHFVGDRPGTGGTAGVGYLIDRLGQFSRPADG